MSCWYCAICSALDFVSSFCPAPYSNCDLPLSFFVSWTCSVLLTITFKHLYGCRIYSLCPPSGVSQWPQCEPLAGQLPLLGVSHWLPISPSTKSVAALILGCQLFRPRPLLLCPYLLSTTVALWSQHTKSKLLEHYNNMWCVTTIALFSQLLPDLASCSIETISTITSQLQVLHSIKLQICLGIQWPQYSINRNSVVSSHSCHCPLCALSSFFILSRFCPSPKYNSMFQRMFEKAAMSLRDVTHYPLSIAPEIKTWFGSFTQGCRRTFLHRKLW